MKTSCPQRDSNRAFSAYEANALSIGLLELISIIENLEFDRLNLPVTRGRYSKMICRVVLPYNICIVLLTENGYLDMTEQQQEFIGSLCHGFTL